MTTIKARDLRELSADDLRRKATDLTDQIFRLRTFGSVAVPSFMDPEGVVIYHEAAKQYFKVTVKDDEKPKGSTE